jgi:hypothetical protein
MANLCRMCGHIKTLFLHPQQDEFHRDICAECTDAILRAQSFGALAVFQEALFGYSPYYCPRCKGDCHCSCGPPGELGPTGGAIGCLTAIDEKQLTGPPGVWGSRGPGPCPVGPQGPPPWDGCLFVTNEKVHKHPGCMWTKEDWDSIPPGPLGPPGDLEGCLWVEGERCVS